MTFPDHPSTSLPYPLEARFPVPLAFAQVVPPPSVAVRCPIPPFPAPSHKPFKHLHLQLFLDKDRNHVVICSLILRHQSRHSLLPPRHSAARAFSFTSLFTSFTSFASLTSSKSFIIRTSKTPFPQLLYNPHLRAPLGSAGNKGLITPLESALTGNSPVTPVESALTKTGGAGRVRARGQPACGGCGRCLRIRRERL